ncbi:pseudouridine synthase [Novosphingobium sp. BL-8H]|uniref:pseudouridine synthase n=1 Tax=Novosphingobium sp. BL-8H TaxID=3127640 RepID=UPI003756F7CE
MSKPPFKSGGPKRGGGGSRDGSFRDGPRSGGSRGNNQRSDAPRGRGDGRRSEDSGNARRDDRPTYSSGSRKPDGGKSFGSRPYGERKSDAYRNDERPRGDRNRDERSGGHRDDRRDDRRDGQRGDRPAYGRGPRKADDGKPFGGRPYGERKSGEYRSDDRPRGDRNRDERSGSQRDGHRDGQRDNRRDDRRSDGPTYSRGPRNKAEDGRSFGSRPYAGRSERDGSAFPRNDRFRDERPSSERRHEERRPRPVRTAPRAAAPTAKTAGMPVREGERIAKLLARAGVASRREAERLIIEGRVRLGEDLIETPSTVLPNLRGVTVDGNPVREAEETRLFIFHKPSGLITAERDPMGRPTIYTALDNALPDGAGRVMPIGRLDLNTEGLLLLTNDGEFKRQLELPATGVPRTYRARTFGDITQSQLEDLIEGIEIDGVIYGKIDANMERRTGRNQWIEMTLTEGKNREVRRVLEHLGLQVSRLIRISYGPFRLLDLPKGLVVEVSERELENFRRTLAQNSAKAAPKDGPKDGGEA